MICGYGEDGVLGVGESSTQGVNIPVEVTSLMKKGITKLALGSSHAMALDAKGTLYTW